MTLEEAIAALAADGVTVRTEAGEVLRLRYGVMDGGYITTADMPLGEEARAVGWLVITAAQFHPDSGFLAQASLLGLGGAA